MMIKKAETKHWAASKLNWVGIGTIAVALVEYLTDWPGLAQYPWAMAALGVLIIVLRTWFTSLSIGK